MISKPDLESPATYTVRAFRSEGWWVLQCVEVPGAISQVQDLDEAPEAMREAIAFVAGRPESDINIQIVREPS